MRQLSIMMYNVDERKLVWPNNLSNDVHYYTTRWYQHDFKLFSLYQKPIKIYLKRKKWLFGYRGFFGLQDTSSNEKRESRNLKKQIKMALIYFLRFDDIVFYVPLR